MHEGCFGGIKCVQARDVYDGGAAIQGGADGRAIAHVSFENDGRCGGGP